MGDPEVRRANSPNHTLMGTQSQTKDIVFLSGKRTGFGSFGGSLKGFSATDLGVVSAQAAIDAAFASSYG